MEIRLRNSESATIWVNNAIYKELGLSGLQDILLQFGLKKIHVDIIKTENVNHVTISTAIIKQLSIPIEKKFYLKKNRHILELGPNIGLLIDQHNTKSEARRLNVYSEYGKAYNSEIGVFSGFVYESINWEDRTVNAQVYDLNLDSWVVKKIALPSVVFNRSRYPLSRYTNLISHWGDSIVNKKVINKWLMFEKLQGTRINEYIPNTTLYNKENILDFINRHKVVYIKPINSARGVGILKLVKLGNSYNVKGTLKEDKSKEIDVILNTEKELILFLEDKISRIPHILQEGLDIIVDNHLIDFRIAVNKDKNLEWTVDLMVAKVANAEGAIVSNVERGAQVFKVSSVLMSHYKYSKNQANEKIKELKSLAIEISKEIDNTQTNYIKLAMDFGIDKKGKIWFIEANIGNPDDKMGQNKGLGKSYDKTSSLIKKNNIDALLTMSGFDENSPVVQFERETKKQEIVANYIVFISGTLNISKNKEIIESIKNKISEVDSTVKVKSLNRAIQYEFEAEERQVKKIIQSINLNEINLNKEMLAVSYKKKGL